ncbi:hypothetical protein ACIBKX_10565 [Streptomyces sp. NPDC050658]|uniref:hypothetical protein n=1 Tax=unclassified Streptomyces TaxID=2593676 RepID=UPI003438DC74
MPSTAQAAANIGRWHCNCAAGPVTGPGGTAHRLARLPGRCLYTHLNNTNPLGNPHAEQHKLLAEWGIEVAAERMVIEL